MIGASKILTVSYGTFSCTLEGFDEPFNTMKAIAEYFRDLAAEDRYFGAEPPTPDAAMLHRIAEREIQRRVEAKISDHGVTLRAEEAPPAPQPAPVLQAPVLQEPVLQASAPVEAAPVETTPMATVPVDDTPVVTMPVVTIPAAEPVAAPAPSLAPALEQAETDNVAARLALLRGTAPAAQTNPAAQPALTDLYAEDQDSDSILSNLAVLTARADAAPAVSYVLDAEAPVAEVAAAPLADLIEDLPEAIAETTAEAPLAVLEDSQPEDTAEDAPPAGLAEAMALNANVEDAETLPEESSAALSDYDDDDAASLDDDDDATLAMLARFASAEPEQVEPVAAQPEANDDIAIEIADEIAAFEPEAPAEPSAQPKPVAELAPQPEPEAEAEAAAPAAEKLQRARARVIRIRRTEPQAATAAETQPEAAPEVAAAPEPAATAAARTASLLSAEAEAALQAELAALEAELAPSAPAAPAAAPAATAPRPVRPARPAGEPDARVDRATRRAQTREEANAKAQVEGRALLETESAPEDVERLIAATNSAMAGEDNKRRHSAIAHLKAAVAATEADRQVLAANPNLAQPSRQDAYRLDLQNVVRPGAADHRPAGDRPPMLVLVSEQRIDRAKPADSADAAEARVVTPTRPRRVTSAPPLTAVQSHSSILDDDDEDDGGHDNVFNASQSFGDFAESLGANSLHELLEASAVYCAQILGCPQFSRTLVMQQLESLPGDAPSREDSLRIFGTLLREGRITKVRRNQFAVTDRSPLLAEALRNAG
jgi:hypothetical protein